MEQSERGMMTQPPFLRAEIPPGTLIDSRYMIQRLLGQGGLGRTYLAEDTRRFNEFCVLKEFAPSGTGEHGLEKSRNLFKREAKILHQIQHPQIPEFLACFEGDGRLFLVQEYVDGQTYSDLLRERQKQGRAFSEEEVMQWLKNLLPVLQYIHERGIIHRDISPDNIMLPAGKTLPVLIDFGVGKQMSDFKDVNHSQAGFVGKMSLVGKVGYAPREQISLGICSPSSDLYALGVTAAVLLTGRDPSLLMDQYSLEWKWRDLAQVSDAFAQVLDKLLVDTPKNRYQTVEEVLTALAKIDRSRGVPGATVIDPRSLESRIGQAEPPRPRQASETIVSFPDEDLQAGLPSTPLSRHLAASRENPAHPASPYPERQASVNSAFIDRCRKELAYVIGPMANLILEEILAKNASLSKHQLVDALEQEIPDPQGAREFRRRLLS
ncbi:MAG TPA: serine/threonine-protein kinase [Coleofasciculaceae cyanobacterium]